MNMFAQKGIVALPDQVYLGEISGSAKRASFLVSRPGRDFAITKITSDSTRFKASSEAVRGKWEHKVTVEFDGKATQGPLNANIVVHTDDPKQPQITVPIKAFIR